MRKNKALGIIDGERCFFPEEGPGRGREQGFGELPVPNGRAVIDPINQLIAAYVAVGEDIFDTFDKHKKGTAHFSPTPNYRTTWPEHGMEGTPGSERHPDLVTAERPELATSFWKGQEIALTPEDDDSYTGVNGVNPETGETLPEWLERRGIAVVRLVGLALGDGAEEKLCVDSTAVDLKNLGIDVGVVTDAVEAVLPENREKCFKNMARLGIKLMSIEEALAEVGAT